MAAPMFRCFSSRFTSCFRVLGHNGSHINQRLTLQNVHKLQFSRFTGKTQFRQRYTWEPLLWCGASVPIFFGAWCLHQKLKPSPVNAAERWDSPRMKYNFIADVVEKAAPTVVHIEIRGR